MKRHRCARADNLQIEVSAPESQLWMVAPSNLLPLLQQANCAEQTSAKRYIQVLQPIEVRVEDKVAGFRPYDGFVLDFQIDFNHPAFNAPHQKFKLVLMKAILSSILPKRTFGFF